MRLVLLADDVHAEFDAFVADEHRRAGDELAHLLLGLAAERAIEGIFRIGGLAHAYSCPGLAGSQGETLPSDSRTGQGLRPVPSPGCHDRVVVAGNLQAILMPASCQPGNHPAGVQDFPPRSSGIGRFSTTSSTRP